jgi:phosphohistidine phosphatase
MALTVVWMRHAKSSWKDQVTDERRELSPRGNRDSKAAGELLVNRGIAFDLVIHSPAERARATWANIAEAGVTVPEEREDVTLYEGDADEIVKLVAHSGASTILVVGHYPTIPEAVELAATRESSKKWAAFDVKFPTSALAFVEADSGEALVAGKGRLVDFVIPRG